MRKRARDLAPGDTYPYHWSDTSVTILRLPESHEDLFGREVLRVWARREDTGAEGWLTYGLDAEVVMS